MKRTHRILLSLALLIIIPAARAGNVANLAADWSDTNNPNSTTFGTWSYRAGSTLLPEVPNWNGNNTTGFTQPAWAPSNTAGDYIPAEFKTTSVPTGIRLARRRRRRPHDGYSERGLARPGQLPLDQSRTGTVTISGDVWAAATIAGRDNAWSLLVNGVAVTGGTNIDAYDRANPFLFGNGTGGTGALTQHVTAGSTIELEIFRTSNPGYFVGANLIITSVPEPGGLVLGGIAVSVLAMTALVRRIRKI